MRFPKRIFVAAAFAALSLAAPRASAHYLWIETPEAGERRVYFGEVQEGAREVTGGRLDEIANPSFRLVAALATSRPLAFERRADHFEVAGSREGILVATETTAAVQDLRPYGIGIVKPMFYARTESPDVKGASSPVSDLDIVPTGKKNEFRVYFRGKAAPKFKVMVYAPNLWMRELVASEDGVVTVETPWKGQYVLDVVHKEPAPGTFKGVAYEAVRHRATLTLAR